MPRVDSINITSIERKQSVDALMQERTVLEQQLLSLPSRIMEIQKRIDDLVRPTLISSAGVGRHPTERESQVLFLIRGGLSNKEIAYNMGLKERTIKNYIRGLMDKFGKRKRGEL